MSDTVTLKRIIDLVTQADIDSGVYTIIDSVSGAVKKYPLGSLICSIAPIFDATEDYAAGTYCNYNGQLYRFTEAHAAGDWTGSDAEAVTVTDVMATAAELAGKADVDGTYEYLTAGMAEQLLSDVQTTDKKPYLFRRTGADATREFDTLVGGSVVSNQLVNPITVSGSDSGITFTSADGAITFSGTATGAVNINLNSGAIRLKAGHVYYIGDVSGGSASTYRLNLNTFAASFNDPTLYKNTGASAGTNLRLSVASGATLNNLKVVPFIIDLTQMFGSAIADYAYTLEQSTAGSGIAWLKSYGFFAGYQAYNAGAMMHVSGVEEHVMTGFNQWDEQWEVGTISSSSGQNEDSASYSRSKNYIHVFPGTEYYFKIPSTLYLRRYDYDKSFLGYAQLNASGSWNAPADTHYLRIVWDGTTYNHDICVNLNNPSKNGAYEPYNGHSYTLDDTVTLRGIPKLSNGEIYYDGDTYAHDGTVTRKYGIRAYQAGDESLTDAITDGTNTVYKLTTPTTETASPFQSPQICDPDGTEQYVTDGIPVGHETQYPANLRGEIERVMVQVPKAPSANGTYTLKCTVSGGAASYAWET